MSEHRHYVNVVRAAGKTRHPFILSNERLLLLYQVQVKPLVFPPSR